jgi:hypothetical protein
MNFSMNILHDINICFIALVDVNYLVFLRRLKHGGPGLGELPYQHGGATSCSGTSGYEEKMGH